MKPLHLTMKLVASIFLSVISLTGATAATLTVTRTADDAAVGSLRWAITQANTVAGADIISFNILDIVSNTFEGTAPNRYAVITLTSPLPTITDAVTIDGTTQANSNVGFMAGRVVGVDAHTQPDIAYPDVYIVCGYTLPTGEAGLNGNGLSINAINTTIQGLAISGFGNTSTNQIIGVAHADITIVRATSARTVNANINQCFLSCDPMGASPTIAARKTKGNGLLVLGGNNDGIIKQNYIAHCGGYGIQFHAAQDNSGIGGSKPLLAVQRWSATDNQVIDIGTSTLFTAANGRAADGISLLNTLATTLQYNFCSDFEQVGIDLGHNTDDNVVDNNTITGFTKTIGSPPCSGMRFSFSSERNSATKNVIFNNTSSSCFGGIYMDEAQTVTGSFSNAVLKNNQLYTIYRNRIYNNTGSGVVLSNNGAGTLTQVTISENSISGNTGLGIDLNYTNGAATSVSINDAGDADGGPNLTQNFPIIDSASITSTTLSVWGKAPAGSTVEFFFGDNGINKHVGRTLNYGEGKTYLATGIEGSAADLVPTGAGTGTDVDGNNQGGNLFKFIFPLSSEVVSAVTSTDSLTSTATLAGNTSEFGPQLKTITLIILKEDVKNFGGIFNNKSVQLSWEYLSGTYSKAFNVERSSDGLHFQTIGEVHNTSTAGPQSFFQFRDAAYLPGNNYYRLRMENANGKLMYTNTIRIIATLSANLVTHYGPNPVINELKLTVLLPREDMITINILDSRGNIFMMKQVTGKAGTNAFTLHGFGFLAKGIYLLEVKANNRRSVETVVLQ